MQLLLRAGLNGFRFLALVADEFKAYQGYKFFEGSYAFVQLFVFSQDIIVLFFDEGDGFFGVVEFAGFPNVPERYKRRDTSAGNKADDDGKVFEHDASDYLIKKPEICFFLRTT